MEGKGSEIEGKSDRFIVMLGILSGSLRKGGVGTFVSSRWLWK